MLALALAALLLLTPTSALDNGILSPAYGWSSWNRFSGSISDALMRECADAIVSSGLAAAGLRYVNLDDGWAAGRYANGTIYPDAALFPYGMKPLVDYVHSKGLLFGLYTARGSTTCLGRPGSDSHEALDAQTYADWGVDYVRDGFSLCSALTPHRLRAPNLARTRAPTRRRLSSRRTLVEG
jgi:alpha-galactosidase